MNHCLLEIKVQKEPTLRYTPDNKTPIAEAEGIFDGLRPEDPPNTIKIVGWGRMAEELKNRVQANESYIIEGRLRMNTVSRQDGTKEKKAELTISKLHNISAHKEIKSTPNSNPDSNLPKVGWDTSPLVPDTDEIPF